MEQDRKPRKKPRTYGQQTMSKEARMYDGEKTGSLISGAISNPEIWCCELWELVMNREALHAAIHGIAKSRTWLRDWTELNTENNKIRIVSDTT